MFKRLQICGSTVSGLSDARISGEDSNHFKKWGENSPAFLAIVPSCLRRIEKANLMAAFALGENMSGFGRRSRAISMESTFGRG